MPGKSVPHNDSLLTGFIPEQTFIRCIGIQLSSQVLAACLSNQAQWHHWPFPTMKLPHKGQGHRWAERVLSDSTPSTATTVIFLSHLKIYMGNTKEVCVNTHKERSGCNGILSCSQVFCDELIFCSGLFTYLSIWDKVSQSPGLPWILWWWFFCLYFPKCWDYVNSHAWFCPKFIRKCYTGKVFGGYPHF